MKIGIDIMGGDFAPDKIIEGVIDAYKELPEDTGIILIGDESKAKSILSAQGFDETVFEYIHTTQEIEMGEHPVKAFTQKKDSGIVKGFHLLKNKEIDAFASAGNTGAMMVGVMTVIKPAKGIIRPCLSVEVPRLNGTPGLILDLGLNPDAKPQVLYQYGIMGSLYAKHVNNIKNPKIALLNIGTEESKGNIAVKNAYKLMSNTSEFNFAGNIEGTDVFDSEKSDVIVCDGFTGNIILKYAEAFYNLYKKRNLKDPFFDKFNFENFGGTPILGINSNVIIAHGHSTARAIKTMILHTREIVNAKLPEKITETFNND